MKNVRRIILICFKMGEIKKKIQRNELKKEDQPIIKKQASEEESKFIKELLA